jgi:PAS domain S-box-containing protein
MKIEITLIQLIFLISFIALIFASISWFWCQYWIGKIRRDSQTNQGKTTHLNQLVECQYAYKIFKNQKEQYQGCKISDILSMGILLHNASGDIVYFNPMAKKILGKNNPLKIPLAHFSQTFHFYLAETQKICPTERLPITQALKGRTIRSTDIEVHHCNKIIPLEIHSLPIFNETGMVTSVLQTLQDITERKQGERLLTEYNQRLEQEISVRTQALRISEERFDLAVRGANDGIWDWNLLTNKVYYSPRWKQIVGCEIDEVGDQVAEFNDRLHPDERKTVWEIAAAYLRQKRNYYEVTHRFKHKKGHYLWILTRGLAIWNDTGQPIRMVGTIVDITAQKQAEEAVRRNEQQLRHYFEQPLIGMASSSLSKGLININDKLCEMWGYSRQELSQMDWTQLTHPDDLAAEEALFNRLVAGEIENYTLDKRYIHKNGQIIYASIAVHGVRNAQQQLEHVVALVEDITARKQIETELQQAKELAEAANHAKSQFLANMSHELRTPLNGILGYTQILMRDKTMTEKQLEGINTIHRCGEHLLMLINDVLDISKIEAGKWSLEPSHFNLTKFLQDIVEIIKMRADKKKLAFIYEPLSSLPVGVNTDEKKLRQILLNLLTNAVKFTQKGGIYFKINYHDDIASFIIKDTGCGIKQEELIEIFLPFQQVGDQSNQTEGTGLGLAISQRLVKILGGQLQVESTPHQGSTFWFEITLPEVKGWTHNHSDPKPIITGIEGATPTILVVDDRQENRAVLLDLLTPIGFNIIEAADGEQALYLAYQLLPDVIITDLVMPSFDGFALMRQIRHSTTFNKTIIFAISASVFEVHQQKSLQAGCDAFISKPIKAEILLNLLQQHLNLKWVYDDRGSISQSVEMPSQTLPIEFIGPSSQQASVLFELLTLGNLRKTLTTATQLAQQDQKLQPFAQEVERLVKNYEVAQLENLIKKYL